jgi:hypothetical protein
MEPITSCDPLFLKPIPPLLSQEEEKVPCFSYEDFAERLQYVECLEPLADVEMQSEDEDYLPSRKEKQNV